MTLHLATGVGQTNLQKTISTVFKIKTVVIGGSRIKLQIVCFHLLNSNAYIFTQRVSGILLVLSNLGI